MLVSMSDPLVDCPVTTSGTAVDAMGLDVACPGELSGERRSELAACTLGLPSAHVYTLAICLGRRTTRVDAFIRSRSVGGVGCQSVADI